MTRIQIDFLCMKNSLAAAIGGARDNQPVEVRVEGGSYEVAPEDSHDRRRGGHGPRPRRTSRARYRGRARDRERHRRDGGRRR
ncbi:protein of unknown function [Candidatus Filomicrobium marinum]|uniref:Uncharacterized protein n=1 Tax=Candidatus Filomicrobium marinum TaxID=1608628 RepID=A0A0D6JFE0_9HYPH|nr:protein of unknown function [Candidatus Filomicrobium marinum]CPR19439.1 protein of unknown function [Candidatus Filomicrobium marinum]